MFGFTVRLSGKRGNLAPIFLRPGILCPVKRRLFSRSGEIIPFVVCRLSFAVCHLPFVVCRLPLGGKGGIKNGRDTVFTLPRPFGCIAALFHETYFMKPDLPERRVSVLSL